MNHESSEADGKKKYEPPRVDDDQPAPRGGRAWALQDLRAEEDQRQRKLYIHCAYAAA